MAQKHRGRIYWPGCSVCQYEKRNPEIRKQILESTFFEPQGKESLMAVWKRWGLPFSEATIYSHMRRHRTKPTQEIELAAPVNAVPIQELEPLVVSASAHERGLDEIIAQGRNMIRSGELKITTQALLTAIKTKSEIEKSKKDQGLEAMKLMAGAFGGVSAAANPGPASSADA
jgi:hypothetical protein